VGEKGKVFGFDIQDRALYNTKKRINELGLMERVELIKDGHENMDKYINTPVKAVMFNLGYLPGGDHKIGTKPQTTIQAIEKAMNLLVKGGVIVVVIYYGGDSGFEEKERVLEFLTGIDQKEYIVMKNEFINQANCPPILVCIEKL
jgi:threonine dehydrogenase-like Zn-dependent dehydrogenase